MTPDQTENPRLHFGFQLVMLARRWRRLLDRELAHSGLTDATWGPLFHLERGGDNISQTELADRIGLDTSSLVRLIDLLEQRGLLERRTDPADRRARRLLLTPRGREKVTQIRESLHRLEMAFLADIDDEQLNRGLKVFDLVGQRLSVQEKKT